MSEKKTHNKKKAAFPQKVKSFFVRIGLAFKNMVAELKKVTWPSRKELTNYSVVVIVFLVLLAVIVGLLDLGGSSLIKLLMGT
jgi:preprotein translocase subunit SecE